MTDQEINEAVARELGYKKYHQDIEGAEGYDYWSDGKHQNKNDLDFTTSIAAAWEIVEFMYEKGTSVILNGAYDDRNWECSWITGEVRYMRVADTAPKAICLAFLKLPN